MGKTVKKMIPNFEWKAGYIENWLTDLAGKGLHLKSLGRVFAEFERGEPEQTIYRADVLGRWLKEEQAEEQIARHEERGWEFVAKNQNYWIFSSANKDWDPELYTDPEVQRKALVAWKKQVRDHLIAQAISILFFIILFTNLILMKTFVLMMIVETELLLGFIAMLYYLSCFALPGFIANLKLQRTLAAEKIPVKQKGDWRKKRLINGTLSVLGIVIFGSVFSMLLVEFDKKQYYPLPDTAVSLPAVRLEEIEPNTRLQREDSYILQDEREGPPNYLYPGNEVSYHWSLLAPVQYDINEVATAKDLEAEDNQSEYTPRVKNQYYRLALSPLTETLMHELIQKYAVGPELRGMVQEREDVFFEKLFWTQSGSQKQVFACRGNEVVYVSYDGNAETEQIIILLRKVISQYD